MVSYVSDNRAWLLLKGSGASVGVFTARAQYDLLIECNAPWTLTIEPLEKTDAVCFSGAGNYVSDIFELDKPTIAKIDGAFTGFKNYFIYLYTYGRYGWSSELISNKLQNGGTVSLKTILKILEPTKCFIRVEFANGEWSFELEE